MNQEIHFKGLSLTPDDHHAQTGELSLSANAELHNGALRPSVITGTTVQSLKVGNDVAKLMCVHSISNYTYLIAAITTTEGIVQTTLYSFDTQGTIANDGQAIHAFTGITVSDVKAVGKTLCIITSDGIHYARLSEGKYAYIGSKMPELELSFGLQCNNIADESFTQVDAYRSVGWPYPFPYQSPSFQYSGEWDNVSDITDIVLSHVNKLIDDSHREGKFLFPFFVRYAYKLYDKSYTMQSAPILMVCGSGTPYVTINSTGVDDDYRSRLNLDYCHAVAPQYTLDLQFLNPSVKTELEVWSDIITDVEIFVSQPLYRYDASGQVKRIVYSDIPSYIYPPLTSAYAVCKCTNNPSLYYKTYKIDDFLMEYRPGTKWLFELPLKSDEDYNESIRNCAEFFFLKKYKISELPTTRTPISIDEGYLNTLTTHTRLSDDYESHDTIIPEKTYVFNNKLNAINIKKELYKGCRPSIQFPYYNDSTYSQRAFIDYIIDQDGHKVFVQSAHDYISTQMPMPFIFYPNTKASMAIIEWPDSQSGWRKINLTKHLTLNGAFYFNGLYDTNHAGETLTPADYQAIRDESSDDPKVSVPNKIYTSEIDNPYFFPLEGIHTIGMERIIGMAGITRSLSPGMLGIHAVMAFCSDGIYALKVSDVGTYTNPHRFSFDVCINSDSICQLGQSVIFATNNGLCSVTESDVNSITEKLDGTAFNPTILPRLAGMVADQLHSPSLSSLVAFQQHPTEFFKTAKLIYDYANSRVIALSDTQPFAYVYSVRDGSWSTMAVSQVALGITDAYPFPYLQYLDGSLVCLDKAYQYTMPAATVPSASPEGIPACVITRAMSFSDTMQAIQAFQQIHNCPASRRPLMILYGSNDNISWKYIGRSNRNHASYLSAHPFRYFRVAILMNMSRAENYSKLLLDVIEKYHKL